MGGGENNEWTEEEHMMLNAKALSPMGSPLQLQALRHQMQGRLEVGGRPG